MTEPDENLLSLNTATVRVQWTLPQVVDVCVRPGIRGIAPWRDQVAAVGLKEAATRLRDAGLDIAEEVKSKGDLAKVQAQFNAWAEETGLPYVQMSRICALSIGENHGPH